MERDPGGARGAGVIDGVADVVEIGVGIGGGDLEEAFGIGLVLFDVVHASRGGGGARGGGGGGGGGGTMGSEDTDEPKQGNA